MGVDTLRRPGETGHQQIEDINLPTPGVKALEITGQPTDNFTEVVRKNTERNGLPEITILIVDPNGDTTTRARQMAEDNWSKRMKAKTENMGKTRRFLTYAGAAIFTQKAELARDAVANEAKLREQMANPNADDDASVTRVTGTVSLMKNGHNSVPTTETRIPSDIREKMIELAQQDTASDSYAQMHREVADALAKLSGSPNGLTIALDDILHQIAQALRSESGIIPNINIQVGAHEANNASISSDQKVLEKMGRHPVLSKVATPKVVATTAVAARVATLGNPIARGLRIARAIQRTISDGNASRAKQVEAMKYGQMPQGTITNAIRNAQAKKPKSRLLNNRVMNKIAEYLNPADTAYPVISASAIIRGLKSNQATDRLHAAVQHLARQKVSGNLFAYKNADVRDHQIGGMERLVEGTLDDPKVQELLQATDRDDLINKIKSNPGYTGLVERLETEIQRADRNARRRGGLKHLVTASFIGAVGILAIYNEIVEAAEHGTNAAADFHPDCTEVTSFYDGEAQYHLDIDRVSRMIGKTFTANGQETMITKEMFADGTLKVQIQTPTGIQDVEFEPNSLRFNIPKEAGASKLMVVQETHQNGCTHVGSIASINLLRSTGSIEHVEEVIAITPTEEVVETASTTIEAAVESPTEWSLGEYITSGLEKCINPKGGNAFSVSCMLGKTLEINGESTAVTADMFTDGKISAFFRTSNGLQRIGIGTNGTFDIPVDAEGHLFIAQVTDHTYNPLASLIITTEDGSEITPAVEAVAEAATTTTTETMTEPFVVPEVADELIAQVEKTAEIKEVVTPDEVEVSPAELTKEFNTAVTGITETASAEAVAGTIDTSAEDATEVSADELIGAMEASSGVDGDKVAAGVITASVIGVVAEAMHFGPKRKKKAAEELGKLEDMCHHLGLDARLENNLVTLSIPTPKKDENLILPLIKRFEKSLQARSNTTPDRIASLAKIVKSYNPNLKFNTNGHRPLPVNIQVPAKVIVKLYDEMLIDKQANNDAGVVKMPKSASNQTAGRKVATL